MPENPPKDDARCPPEQWLRTARFDSGAASVAGFPDVQGLEVAFAGRSNAGKSSVLNRLCDNRRLARVGRMPGRTREVNFFMLAARTSVPGQAWLVDLPGYGYARMPRSQVPEELLNDYLWQRQTLAGMVLIVDIRREMSEGDATLIDICRQRQIPLLAVLNKADKLNRTQLLEHRRQWQSHELETLPFSALKGKGTPELAQWISVRLQATTLHSGR